MTELKPGTRVKYTPTGETGTVRLNAYNGSYFVVYDHKDEKATLTSDWCAQLTPADKLEVIHEA